MQRWVSNLIIILIMIGLITACTYKEESFIVKNPDLIPEITVLDNGSELINAIDKTHDFGTLTPNTTSEAKTLTIRNDGTGPLTIQSISLENSVDFFIETTPALPYDLPVNQSMSVSVSFKPHIEGDYERVAMTILSDDSDEASYNYYFDGAGSYNGSPGEISITLKDDTVYLENNIDQYTYNSSNPTLGQNYEFIKRNSTNSVTYTLENTGTGDLIIDEISVRDDAANVYSITNGPSAGMTLGKTETVDFNVEYTPSANEEHFAWIKIDNGNIGVDDFAFYVKGTGAEPFLVLIDDTEEVNDVLYFDTITTGGATATKSNMKLKNTGEVPLVINSMTLTDLDGKYDDLGDGSLTYPITLDKDESSDAFSLTFGPTVSDGGYSATLTIDSDSSDGTRIQKVRGGTAEVFIPEGVAVWLDASDPDGDGTAASDIIKNTWVNKTGTGFNAELTDGVSQNAGYNATVSDDIDLKTNVINSTKPAMLFQTDQDNLVWDAMYISEMIADSCDAITVFMVFQMNEFRNEDAADALDDDMILSVRTSYPYYNINQTRMYIYDSAAGAGRSFNYTFSTDTPYVMTNIQRTNSTSDAVEIFNFWLNGEKRESTISSVLTTPVPNTNRDIAYITIGNYRSNNAYDDYGINGYIAELIIYDQELDYDGRKRIENYLGDKYGLTINQID